MVDIFALNIIGLICIVPFLVCQAFWIWMLVDCLTKEPSEGNDKLVWAVVIVLTNFLGALIYFLVRRPERIRAHANNADTHQER